MKKLHTTLGIITMAFLASFNSQGQTNKLVLTKGQKLELSNEVKSKISMEMMGQSMEIISNVNMLQAIEVNEKSDSGYAVSATLKKMKMEGSAMGQNMNYDSEKKEDQDTEIGKNFKNKINAVTESQVNENGKTTSVKKLATEVEGAEGGNPMAMMQNMGGGNNEEAGAGAAFMVLPAGKKVSDSWSDSSNADGVKVNRTYTVKDVKGSETTVTLKGTQSISKKIENQGMEVNVLMDTKLSGEITVDTTTGLVKQKTITVEGTGTSEVMGQSIPITTVSTTTTIVK
jgi:Family of unknown function (DUF6263)